MKKEYVIYGAEIERYIAVLPGKKPGEMAGESSKEKTSAALSAFMKILSKNGRTWPNESDYSEYAEGKPDSKATQQNLSRVRSFFLWLEKRKENDTPMKENEVYIRQDLFTENEAETLQASEEPEALGAIEPEIVPGVDDETRTENVQASEEAEAEMTAPSEPESWPEPVKNKRGRKRLDDNGEKLEKFATVYLTPRKAAQFMALCEMDNVKISARITELIEREISGNIDWINDYLAFKERRKEQRKNG